MGWMWGRTCAIASGIALVACGDVVSDDAPDAPRPDATPASCRAILAADPIAASGAYTVDPDGEGGDAALSVECDMVTAGGGWTIVFVANSEFEEVPIAYTSATPRLLSDAAEVLLAFRDADVALVGAAVFAIPNDWRFDAPFNYPANDIVADVRVDGAEPVSATLRYGHHSFGNVCSDAWAPEATWGRICITGTTAPYYSGFAVPSADMCSDSSMGYAAISCGLDRKFSIAVR
jgi:hypothetical protein